MTAFRTEFEIDGEDRIQRVSDSWLEFAAGNGAGHLNRDRVVGERLFRFVHGPEVRLLYAALHQRIRSGGRPAELPFRCDSPSHLRAMRMHIEPTSGDSLRVVSILESEVPREPVRLLDPEAPRSAKTLSICSLCKAIRLRDDQWADLEQAIAELDLLGRASLPQLSHGVCPACEPLFHRDEAVGLD